MDMFSQSTSLTQGSWKATIAEDIAKAASSDSMEYIYKQLKFTPKTSTTSYADPIPQIIYSCFFDVFAPLFKQVAYSIQYNRFIDGLLNAIESGLFLDFILFSIDFIWNMQCDFAQVEIDDGLPLYRNLLRAAEKRCILHNHIQLPEEHRNKRDKPKTIKFLKAYERQLTYFYGNTGNLILPEFRRTDASDITKYSFSIMGKPFDSDATEAEIWINFSLREKYWGTNLAALISSQDPVILDYASKDIWSALSTESSTEATIVDRLMRFPFPACRMTYIQTALNTYVSSNGDPFVGNFKDFLKLKYMFYFISDAAIPISHYDAMPCFPADIEAMQKQALYLSIATQVQLISYGLERDLRAPTYAQILSWLSTPENLKAIQDSLCKLAGSEIGKLCGRPCSSVSDLNDQWPLLLLSQSSNHTKALLDVKMSPVRGRSINDQAFTAAQARCYGSTKQ